jgi:hypothetical protein
MHLNSIQFPDATAFRSPSSPTRLPKEVALSCVSGRSSNGQNYGHECGSYNLNDCRLLAVLSYAHTRMVNVLDAGTVTLYPYSDTV